ncbi:MAG: hypothetical protein U0271_41510 [Polyangiaceae bacterium]
MDPVAIDLRAPIQVLPAGVANREFVFEGSLHNADGSEIDATTTTWPAGVPGGAGVDPGGLIDFEAGGLHLISRDPANHRAVATWTGKPGPACADARIASPCIVLRTAVVARSRLLTRAELLERSNGAITLRVSGEAQPALDREVTPAGSGSTAWVVAVFAVLLAVIAVGLTVRGRVRAGARLDANPEEVEATEALALPELTARVSRALKGADDALVATLTPALKRIERATKSGALDQSSPAGQRVKEALLALERSVQERKERATSEQQQRLADDLLGEMQASIDAAAEAIAHAGH